jgi:formyltetrahydrofolate deformylase
MESSPNGGHAGGNTDKTGMRTRTRNSPLRTATITVIGRDKTGVIARVTNYLFEQGANIESLEEHVKRGQFSMVLEASWSAGPEPHLPGLAELARSLEMEIKVHFQQRNRRQRMAIMVTSEPVCLTALLSRCGAGKLGATPAVVLSNRKELAPVAAHYHVPFVHVAWTDRKEAEAAALRALEEHDVDFVVLARFMKILSPNFVWRYPKRIINIHPSLLPSFPGAQAYRQAWERGVKMAGVTAHFVTMNLDEGPIIAQACFPIRPQMPLTDIIKAGQKLEARVLVKAVRLYLSNCLEISWGIVSGC